MVYSVQLLLSFYNVSSSNSLEVSKVTTSGSSWLSLALDVEGFGVDDFSGLDDLEEVGFEEDVDFDEDEDFDLLGEIFSFIFFVTDFEVFFSLVLSLDTDSFTF